MTPYYPPTPEPDEHADAWPREYHEVTIPLSRYHGALLAVPKQMTRAEWERMLEYLTIMEQVTVQDSGNGVAKRE